MAEGTLPRDIWDQGFEEGERRMNRRLPGLASTALLGGFDVMLGLALVFSLSGALMAITTPEVAHAIGALPFGVAFIFITVGRSELFTENFLVPVGAFFAGRGTARKLMRMWGVTLAFNFVGIAILAALLSIDGVLPDGSLAAAGELGDKFVDRGLGPGLASAVVAGVAITLYTWLVLATKTETARIIIALVIGYVLLLPILNHAIVGFGEVMLAIFGGETVTTVWDVTWRLLVAIVGNVIGGVGFVTMTRLVQVSGEPHDAEHAKRQGIRERILLPSAFSGTRKEVRRAEEELEDR
ncbi:MAG TPA: formate/nitrite transporter family protein [Solirubrobacterales bacterium]|nr:formate/nitrite transporter family protein [Solirubrobacterales bacterium]